VVGKKKSTGLSRRTGFLDRDTIAEDRAIQRYNESLEEEARQALRPANAPAPFREREERGGRGGRPGPGGSRGRAPREGGGAAGRPPRPPKPPAVPPEVVEALGAAAALAGQAAGMSAEASRLVERLVAGAKFESAAGAGWDLLVQTRGSDRTPKQWDDLRREWDAVRQAIGAVWAQTHPDDAPAAIKIRPPKRRRGARTRGRGDGAAAAAPGGAAGEQAAEGQAVEGAADEAPDGAAGTTAPAASGEGRKPRRRRRGGRGRSRRRGAARAVRPVAVVLAPGVERLPRPALPEPEPEPVPAGDVVLAPVETEVLVEPFEPTEPTGPEVPVGSAVPPGSGVPEEPETLLAPPPPAEAEALGEPQEEPAPAAPALQEPALQEPAKDTGAVREPATVVADVAHEALQDPPEAAAPAVADDDAANARGEEA
jgi:ribonuclease E